MSDALPAIAVDGFSIELPRCEFRTRRTRRTLAFVARIERATHWYGARIGAYRGFSPRLQSRVEHRVDRDADAMLRSIGLQFDYDRVAHEFRAPVRLRVAWSWPALPVWLSVTDAGGGRSAIALQLRSRRRLHYPRRYYATAHDLLRAIRSG